MMPFNPGKCYTMEISYIPPTQVFTFCGQELQMVDSQPYLALGVKIDYKMTWSVHIKNTISKGGTSGTVQQMLGLHM